MNDNGIEVEIKVDPIIKIIPDTMSYMVIFCTQNEKIQIQDHGSYALIASMAITERQLPTLIGIIKNAEVRLDDKYNGEALYLKEFINKMFHRMLTLKSGGKDELDVSKDSLQENRT